MIERISLTDQDALAAIDGGEFAPAVVGASRCVAVILTQSWCPDWMRMQRWMDQDSSRAHEIGLTVCVLEYDKISSFPAFRSFKEQTFGNQLIPYIRYYVNGKYVSDSNQLRPDDFYARFTDTAPEGE